jgi:predicted MPP superfamily phosphohydrolase
MNCIGQSNANNRLAIIGLNDPVTHRDNLAAALDGLPEEDAKILLTHYQNFTINSKMSEHFKSIDLVLSGHTHGGQIFILKHLPSFVNRWYFKRKSDKENKGSIKANHRRVPSVFNGLCQQGQTIGYINRGLGTSYFPIRLGVRPEITVLEFSV